MGARRLSLLPDQAGTYQHKSVNTKYSIGIVTMVAYTVTKQKMDNSDPIPYSCFASEAADAYTC